MARLGAALERIRSAEDGTLSSDATLRSLKLAGIDIGQFNADQHAYAARVPLDATYTAVVAIPTATDTQVMISNGWNSSDRSAFRTPLDEGTTTVTVEVTSPDASNTETYTVAVTRTGDMPAIAGTAHEGEVLTVDLSRLPDGYRTQAPAVAYQWMLDGADVDGATEPAFTVPSGHVGEPVRVRVSLPDEGGDTVALMSAAMIVEEPPWPLPYRPEALRAEAKDGAVRLSWDAPEGIGWVSNHLVWRHRPESGELEPTAHTAETHSVARSFTDTDVEPGVLYSYRVQATDLFGYTGEVSEAVTVRMPAAETPPPANLKASANANGTITLTWDAPEDDTVDGYRILRRRPTEALGARR